MNGFWVNGIVAVSDGKPYLQLSNEQGIICQLRLPEARQIALDMLQMAARTEMDAMVLAYFEKLGLKHNDAGHLMAGFREYRAEIDQQAAERPDDPERPGVKL